MNKIKEYVIIVLVVVTVFSNKYQYNVIAEKFDSEKGSIVTGFASSGSYDTFVSKKISGVYSYWTYKYSKTGRIIYCKKMVTPKMNHQKGKSGKTVAASVADCISFSETKTWNTSIGASFGIDDNIKASASAGYGTSKGWSVSKSIQRNTSLSESGIKNAPTGIYAIAAGERNYQMRCKKFNWITDKLLKTYIFYMPFDEDPVLYTVYSKDEEETWKLYD